MGNREHVLPQSFRVLPSPGVGTETLIGPMIGLRQDYTEKVTFHEVA